MSQLKLKCLTGMHLIQLEITLTAPDGAQYTPMFDTKSISNSENFKLGTEFLTQGTQSSLSNVALYKFVASIVSCV